MIFDEIKQNDIQGICKLQPEGWPSIIEAFSYYVKAPFCYPMKVSYNGEIVGIGTAISYGNTAWLAHIIVSKEHRKNGIGAAIVNYLCNYLKNSGHNTISLIATELGYPVYKKAGFTDQTEYLCLQRTDIMEYSFSNNLSLISDKYKEQLFFLDKKIFGENRKGLLSKFLENGYIYIKGSKVLGYYLKELGEGLIIANDMKAGKELVKFRCSFSNKAVLPIDNSFGIDFYKENGFEEKFRLKKMVYGEKIVWEPNKIFSRIGGNFG